MPKPDKPAASSGPPPQDELPPTAAELDARVRALEEAKLEELGLLGDGSGEAPAGPPAPAKPERDLLDRMFDMGAE